MDYTIYLHKYIKETKIIALSLSIDGGDFNQTFTRVKYEKIYLYFVVFQFKVQNKPNFNNVIKIKLITMVLLFSCGRTLF